MRVAVDLVVEVDDAGHALDELELGLEAAALLDVHPGLGHHDHAALGAVQVALEVLVGGAGADDHVGVHLVGDVDGVGEGAVRLHAGEAVLLRLHVHDDALQALGGQHAEAQVHRLGDARALVAGGSRPRCRRRAASTSTCRPGTRCAPTTSLPCTSRWAMSSPLMCPPKSPRLASSSRAVSTCSLVGELTRPPSPSRSSVGQVGVVAAGAVVAEVVVDAAHGALVDDAPVAEQEGVLGVLEHLLAVGDHDDGGAALLEVGEGIEDARERLHVDARVRLVHEHDARLHGEDAGELHALALAAGQRLVHGARRVLLGVEPHAAQHPLDRLAALCPWRRRG